MNYYNENPQITYWKERYESMKKEYDHAVKCYFVEVQSSKELSKRLHDSEEFELLQVREVHALRKQIREFNLLPWYKKIKYKFSV